MLQTQHRQFRRALLAMFPAVCLLVSCRDDYSEIRLPQITNGAVGIVIPDKSIYGIPIGTPREAFLRNYGEPTGQITLSNSHTAILYGKTHAFLFHQNALVGVSIKPDMNVWRFHGEIPDHAFDSIKWQLNNGITNGSSLDDVQRIAGIYLQASSGANRFYIVGNSWVELDFVYNPRGPDSVYALHVRRSTSPKPIGIHLTR